MNYSNENIYNGNWKENRKEGKGIMIYKNGNKFEGIFKEDKVYIGNGYIYYENGDIYNGHIENGMKNGKEK